MPLHSGVSDVFLFNSIKHHLGCIKDFIVQSKTECFLPDDINHQLIQVGKSMIDFYYGNISQLEIIQEIKRHLKSMNCYDSESYYQFISISPKNYRILDLSDGSSWTLLIGKKKNRYIHIHPSRGSMYTLRARALALKTAILLLIFYADELNKVSIVKLTNEVRKKYLGEPPIKNEIYTTGLRRILELF